MFTDFVSYINNKLKKKQIKDGNHRSMAPKKQVRSQKNAASAATPIATSAATTSRTATTTRDAPTVADTTVIVADVYKSYINDTPRRLKLIDAFMLFLVAVGVLQFVYCVLVTSYVSSQVMILLISYLLDLTVSCRLAVQCISIWIFNHCRSIRSYWCVL